MPERYEKVYHNKKNPREEAEPHFDIEIGAELHVVPGYRGSVKGNVPITIDIYHE